MSVDFLSGFRIVDLTDELGIFCGRILADFGAEVIKVERPGGDPARNRPPFYGDDPSPEKSLFWAFTNLNKKSVTLDISCSQGRELLKKLIKRSDLVIESFRPGDLECMGLGYPELAKVNRHLVLTSITPYGQSGPYANYPAGDITIMAAGGMLRLHADTGRPPVRFSVPLTSFLGGLHAATGSIVALTHAELSGEGQQVDVSCQEAVAMSLMDATEFWDINGVNRQIVGPFNVTRRRDLPDLVVPRVWECRDGHMLIGLVGGLLKGVAAGSNALVKMANEQGMALQLKDYDFGNYDASTMPVEESDRMVSAMGAFFRTMAKGDLFEMSVTHGSLAFPVNTVADIAHSPQFEERGFWVDVEDPEGRGKIKYPGLPMRIEGMAFEVARRAPRIGEHNREIYQRELGLSSREMTLLRSQGVI